MIGIKNLAAARLALVLGDAAIAGDRGVLADNRDRCVPVRAAVAVDDEPRIGLQYRRGIERARQALGDASDPDIPGDMTLPFALGHAEIAETARHRAPGVIGGQKEVGTAVGTQHADGIGVVEQRSGVHAGSEVGFASLSPPYDTEDFASRSFSMRWMRATRASFS
jgi:hypothetical protein